MTFQALICNLQQILLPYNSSIWGIFIFIKKCPNLCPLLHHLAFLSLQDGTLNKKGYIIIYML